MVSRAQFIGKISQKLLKSLYVAAPKTGRASDYVVVAAGDGKLHREPGFDSLASPDTRRQDSDLIPVFSDLQFEAVDAERSADQQHAVEIHRGNLLDWSVALVTSRLLFSLAHSIGTPSRLHEHNFVREIGTSL
jgi:hypothetical protein